MIRLSFILINEIQIQYCLDNQLLMLDYGFGICVDSSLTNHFPENDITIKYVDEDGQLLSIEIGEIEL